MTEALIGLDIGTTGCKAVIFDPTGKVLAKAYHEYTVDMPQPGWAEQDGERVWRLAQDCLRRAIAAAGIQTAAAVGFSVQGEAVMPVDQAGNALRPAILGMDTRTTAQNEWLREKIGAERLFAITGMPLHTINTLPKLLWLKENEPELWQKACRFLLYEDFIIQKMTGQAVISRCLASRTQLYDLKGGAWSAEILELAGLTPERLAEVQPSGYAVGWMSSVLAHSLGLKSAPRVVTGGHDQACGALGVGLTRPGRVMVSTGTAEVVEVALDNPVLNDPLYQGNISCYAHVVPGLYLAMTLNHSGGLLLRWFRDTFCQDELRIAKETQQDAYDLILEHASENPSGLLVLPHFAGSGTPWFDTTSKGAILGLTFNTTRQDIAKAILDGLTYELRLNLDILKAGGIALDELRAIGGGARSPLWLQLKADVTGLPVSAPRVTEAAAWGAALLAGSGAGMFPSAAEAAENTLHFEHTYLPDAARVSQYEKMYQLYRQVYPAVRAIQGEL